MKTRRQRSKHPYTYLVKTTDDADERISQLLPLEQPKKKLLDTPLKVLVFNKQGDTKSN